MKKSIFFLATIFVLCSTYAQTKNDIALYSTQKPQYRFIENKGQIHDQNYKSNPDVKFLLCLENGMNVQLKANSFSYDTYKTEIKEKKKDTLGGNLRLYKETEKDITYYFHRIDVELVGANANPQIIVDEPSADYLNYYNAVTPESGAVYVRSYKKVTYKSIYPGIDMVFEAQPGKEKPIEYTFIVHPGADARQIKLHYVGANQTKLAENEINVDVAHGRFTESISASWIKETNTELKITYISLDINTYGFKIPSYSETQTLIIDPNPNLDWGTYYGGNISDWGHGITTDGTSNILVTGRTNSTNTIATSGTHQAIIGGYYDAFVVKFDYNGVRQWGTYYGGNGDDFGYDIACDRNRNVFITGFTKSTDANTIATSGAFLTTITPGHNSGYITKLDSNGIRQWGTYYGDGSNGNGIICDTIGNVFITGQCYSIITTTGAYQPSFGGGEYDAYVAKFNTNGQQQWATYYGGSNDESGGGITSDGNGNVIVTGYTLSETSIASPGAHQAVIGGDQDGFIAKFNNDGVRQWCTYYGGHLDDGGLNITCDQKGNVYLVGRTMSNDGISTPGAFLTNFPYGNVETYFIAKFNKAGIRLWGTFYAGSVYYRAGISCDLIGNVYAIGDALASNSIATTNAFQTTFGGATDAFIVKFDSTGSRKWGTFYGGNDYEHGYDIVNDNYGNVYITGSTESPNAIATVNSFQNTFGGGDLGDAFIAKLSTCDYPANAGTISGLATVCQWQDSVIYTVPTITNATSYVWTLPAGATGTSTTNSIFVHYSVLSTSGNITVKGINSCGEGGLSSLAIAVNYPEPADTISGLTTVCQGQNSVNYFLPVIDNAVSYLWSLPNGSTGTSTSNSISVNYSTSAESGFITVKGQNACGYGDSSVVDITVNHLPDNAGPISGLTTVCQGQDSVVYTVPVIPYADLYQWTFPNSNALQTTSNSVFFNFDTTATTGYILVGGYNECGTGYPSFQEITVIPLPESAGTISGPITVCQGQNAVIYSVPSIANATSYIWSLPTGVTGSSTINSISVDYSATAVSGNITVKGNNTCHDGEPSSLAVSVNSLPPEPAGSITGLSTVCQGQNDITYSVPVIPNATSYFWTLPIGATGTSSSNSITVNYGTSAVSGNITVEGNNGCGDGIPSV